MSCSKESSPLPQYLQECLERYLDMFQTSSNPISVATLFPDELWCMILDHVQDDETLKNCQLAHPQLHRLVHHRRHLILFYKIFPLIYWRLFKRDICNLRLTCKSWCTQIDELLCGAKMSAMERISHAGPTGLYHHPPKLTLSLICDKLKRYGKTVEFSNASGVDRFCAHFGKGPRSRSPFIDRTVVFRLIRSDVIPLVKFANTHGYHIWYADLVVHQNTSYFKTGIPVLLFMSQMRRLKRLKIQTFMSNSHNPEEALTPEKIAKNLRWFQPGGRLELKAGLENLEVEQKCVESSWTPVIDLLLRANTSTLKRLHFNICIQLDYVSPNTLRSLQLVILDLRRLSSSPYSESSAELLERLLSNLANCPLKSLFLGRVWIEYKGHANAPPFIQLISSNFSSTLEELEMNVQNFYIVNTDGTRGYPELSRDQIMSWEKSLNLPKLKSLTFGESRQVSLDILKGFGKGQDTKLTSISLYVLPSCREEVDLDEEIDLRKHVRMLMNWKIKTSIEITYESNIWQIIPTLSSLTLLCGDVIYTRKGYLRYLQKTTSGE